MGILTDWEQYRINPRTDRPTEIMTKHIDFQNALISFLQGN